MNYQLNLTRWDVDYFPQYFQTFLDHKAKREAGDIYSLSKESESIKLLLSQLDRYTRELTTYWEQLLIHSGEVLEGLEEVDTTSNPLSIPMEGMPWNIPGGVHSPEAIPASEYVDREMIHQMTVREDLLSQE